MARRIGWTLALASIAPALLLTHPGCAGRSISHGEDSGGGAGRPSSSTGTGGSGSVNPKGSVLDFTTIDCAESLLKPSVSSGIPATDFLSATCAKSFCHGPNFVVNLDLRPDQGFAQRLLDAPALHGGIPCPGDVTKECIPDWCPSPGTVNLIDSQNPMASWILTTTRSAGTCGERMPDSKGLTPDQDACLTAIVEATAALK